MVNPNWGLATQPNAFQNALATGVQMGQIAKRQEADNALAAYAMNPSDPKSQENLARNAPRVAMQEAEKRTALEKEARFRQLRKAALLGDENAKIQIAAEDNAAYNQMGAEQRAESDRKDKAMAQAVFQLEQLPPEQRGARWDQLAQELGAPELVGTYSPVAVDVILSKGGVAKAFQEFMQPDINFVPADAQAYAGNAAGEGVLQAMGRTNGALPPPPPGFVIDEGGPASAPGNFPE